MKAITRRVSKYPILGPLLFMLYINDMSENNSLLYFNLFADDIAILYSNKVNIRPLVKVINYSELII